jgi:hypothetical protein
MSLSCLGLDEKLETRSTRSLMARLELDSLYNEPARFFNEPARFIMSQLEPTREPLASHNKPSKLSRNQLKLVRHLWPIHHLHLGPAQLRTLTLSAAPQRDESVNRDPLVPSLFPNPSHPRIAATPPNTHRPWQLGPRGVTVSPRAPSPVAARRHGDTTAAARNPNSTPPHSHAAIEVVTEDGEEIQGIPAVAMPASLGSRSKRKKMSNNHGHGGRGRGRGSANTDTVFIFVEDLICSFLPRM